MKRIILLLMLIINFGIASGIYTEEGNYYPWDKNVDKKSEMSTSASSSSTEFVQPSETALVNITRKIVSPLREDGFFNEANEKIAVLIKVTSLRDGLQDLEIWEMPGPGLIIDNCSYPLRTSGIGQILDYEISDKSFLKLDDIYENITYIKSKFNLSNKDPLYRHIFRLLSDRTRRLLSDPNVGNDELRLALFKDFSEIIDNGAKNFNKTNFIGSNATFRNDTLIGEQYQGYTSNTNNFVSLNESRLFKRRLLEDAFPKSIRRISYFKEHEDLLVSKSPQKILVGRNEIKSAPLQEGESIIFKYYLHPEKLGKTSIRSVIRAKGFWHEESTSLNIIERAPKFEIDYWVGSKELTLNKKSKFEYSIKYIGGDEANKKFAVIFHAPPNCTLENYTKNIDFSIGKDEKITVNATYNQTGSAYSPPGISIEGFRKVFLEDIKVYTENQKDAKIGYELISTELIRNSLWIAVIAAFIAILEIFSMHRNQKSNDIRFFSIHEANNKVIDAHNGAMIALRNVIAERSVESCSTQEYLDEWTKPKYYP